MRFLKILPDGELSITKDLAVHPAPYAILSHRWATDDDDEVNFKNWNEPSSRRKPGFAKLTFCADQARREKLEYFWVDTCCINRNNAVELDEAIRSMFRWYQNAAICYVYLSDVEAAYPDIKATSPPWEVAFRNSDWFERGWTLQELLAPKSVVFFSKDGLRLGTKETLEQEIHDITGIPLEALRCEALSKFSANERFKWAKNRRTTKTEDKAYCLFGIFGVFLPIMYGEGSNAFSRLRNEIGITIDQIDAAIEKAYGGPRLTIERLSGKTLPLEDCFINLSIVDHRHDGDRRASAHDSDNHSNGVTSRFSLAARLKVEDPPASTQISLQTLFDVRKQKDGIESRPNRVLIWGGAGMGKTTLCKKIVHDFYHNDLWRNVYDRLVWLPLRKLKLMEHKVHNIAGLLEMEFRFEGPMKNLADRLQYLVDQDSRTLFILDGLDEVSYILDLETPIGCVLNDLVARPNVIITSRPHSTRMLDRLPPHLELETIGFSSTQVKEYIQHTAKETNMPDTKLSELQSFVESRPLVQSLARIPIQLDAIYYAWGTKHFPQDNVSMARLYQAISQKLWAKDIIRLRKKHNGDLLKTQQLETYPNVEGYVEAETMFLQDLAFQGLCQEVIEFESIDMKRLHKDQPMLDDVLVQMSFLRSSDNSLEACDQTLHFIHLTFQEFFAAKYFVRHWISNAILPLWKSSRRGLSTVIAERISPEQFLRMEKYVHRYDIFWRFVTGLLSMEDDLSHLHRFFRVLDGKPADLVGMTHQRLTIHCLSELGQPDDDFRLVVREREERYIEWILCERRLNQGKSRTSLMWEAECSEYILEALLNKPETRLEALRMLCHRPSVSPNVLELISNILDRSIDKGMRAAAIRALCQHCSSPREENLRFWRIVQGLLGSKPLEFAHALVNSQKLQQPVIEALVTLLRDPNGSVRSGAAEALGRQTSLSPSAIEALVTLLRDLDESVRSRAAWALGRQSLSPSAIEALVTLLRDLDESVRYRAAEALGRQTSLSPSAIEALVTLLRDPDKSVRSRASEALDSQTSLSPSAIEALVTLLRDPDKSTRSGAAEVLHGREEIFVRISGLDSLALQGLLEAWLRRGSVTCSVWNECFFIDILGKRWTVPLHSGQQASLEKAWGKAQQALRLPEIASQTRQNCKPQADAAFPSPQKRHRLSRWKLSSILSAPR